jgi:hypothetical protein
LSVVEPQRFTFAQVSTVKDKPAPNVNYRFCGKCSQERYRREDVKEAAREADKLRADVAQLTLDVSRLRAENKRIRDRLRVALDNAAYWQSLATRRSRVDGGDVSPLPLATIKKLLALCHPDRHDNSELSNEVTRWLINQRKK